MKTNFLNSKPKAWRQVQIFKTNYLKKHLDWDLEEMRERDPIEEDIKLIEQKHQQLEEKIYELEDRSTPNVKRFSE